MSSVDWAAYSGRTGQVLQVGWANECSATNLVTPVKLPIYAVLTCPLKPVFVAYQNGN